MGITKNIIENESFNPKEHPHRRFNPLAGDWVLVSPHRTKRPWQGQVETSKNQNRPQYDPTCYLCPGNIRAENNHNPIYDSTFIFQNDYSALLPQTPSDAGNQEHPLLRYESEKGLCRVICFSPRHDLTLTELPLEGIKLAINAWRDQIDELGKEYNWVQIFENKGEMMGCSNAHPHGQVWAGSLLPDLPEKENYHQKLYYEQTKQIMLLDYVKVELERMERIVVSNDHWVVCVPYWAVWPYETLLLPKRHVPRLLDLEENERNSLAEILKAILVRYDNLFSTDFPYSMGWHGAPTGTFTGNSEHYWQLHAHFYPPLLRSASVKKFMVGYELLADAQRDLTPEQAVERLRSVPEVHYASR